MSTSPSAVNVYPQLSPAFTGRRTLNWLAVGLLYAFFYTTRYNWTVVSPKIANVLGWQNAQLGVFETMMPIVYALSVILNGPIADRIGGKKAFLFGAAGVVIMNVLFGLASLAVVTPAVWEGVKQAKHIVTPAVLRPGVAPGALLSFMAVTWGLNGYFQAFGALSIVKINAHWFHVRERGTFSGVFGVLIRLGLLLAFQGVPLILLAFPWQYAFWIPAACVALFFLICLGLVHNTPAEAGFGEFETGDAGDEGSGPASLGFVLSRIFASRAAWTIALASMMIGFVRRSHLDAWWPRYLEQYHGASPEKFATYAPYLVATWGIALSGIAGGFAFGISSDRRFGGRRAPVITFGFIGMAVALAASGVSDHLHMGPMLAAIWLVVLSFCVNGAHGMIGGAASMDFGGKKATATAAGMFDGMQYLTAFLVGPGVPIITKRWGWEAWHWAPIPFALIGALLIGTLWNVVPSRKTGH
jgi:OPA family glycerol-3-phosphate transporter-like MFS transporter